jgi:hypothetical protein
MPVRHNCDTTSGSIRNDEPAAAEVNASEPLVADFIVGGAPRSGTTVLAELLDRHPQIRMARPLIPEPKVFLTDAGSPAAFRERYRAFFDPSDRDLIRGEKTANYLESDSAPALIRATLPDVRMLFLFREPLERARSNWRWSRRNGLETLSFVEAIEREGQRADPFPPARAYAKPYAYLERANYGAFARRWISALGRGRVAFFLFEDLVGRERERVVRDALEFVGADPCDLGPLPTEIGNETDAAADELDAGTHAQLRERLRPLVEDFAATTGLDVGRWGY